MHHFKTTLVSGRKSPYDSWTFLEIPVNLARQWGLGRHNIRGTIAGHRFRGTASRGEGVLRMPIPGPLREKANLRRGMKVDVALTLDTASRPVRVPSELGAVLRKDPRIAVLFAALPPSHRRAWAAYVGEAKQPETRLRRANRASAGIRARAFPR